MSDCSSGDEYEECPNGDFFPPCQDLYSNEILDSATACWAHMKEKYGIDIQVLIRKHRLDPFSYIRMVNFIRSEQPSPSSLMEAKTDEAWRDMKWMRPALENDALLMYDVLEEEEEEVSNGNIKEVSFESPDSNSEPVTISYDEYRMLKKFKDEFEPALESFREQTECMTAITQRLVQDTSVEGSSAKPSVDERLSESVSALVMENEDQNYASSYSHFGIHHEMLSDVVRTSSYQKAIEMNANSTIRSKNILDLGCGTGILSLFCARAGAKEVTAVDMSDVLSLAIDIAHENGYEDVISFKKGRLENIPDIDTKFDVIVSEWMGYFLLFEGMLDSVIDARDKYLKPNGRLLPNRCSLHLAAVCDMDRYSKTVGYWKDVYGFKMSCMTEPVLEEASVEIVSPERIISESSVEILNLDLEKCSIKDYSSFSQDLEFKIKENGHITAICGYFDTDFELPENTISFTTGPKGIPTHWKQTLFYMKNPLKVTQGEIVRGSISVKRPKRDPRSLVVKLKLNDMEQKYVVD